MKYFMDNNYLIKLNTVEIIRNTNYNYKKINEKIIFIIIAIDNDNNKMKFKFEIFINN